MGSETLQLDESSQSVEKLQITRVRFYISNIQLLKNGKVVATEKDSYHLIDASDKSSLSMAIPVKSKIDYDEIFFLLGIDSLTNFSGVMGGDLDPTKGMYWAWNSGYINFKLEGKSPLCETRNNEFSFHLGGYSAPYPSYQIIKLAVKKSNQLTIKVDFAQFLEQIDLAKQTKVMSPGKLAQDLSIQVAKLFSVQ
tara:strand:+ start:1090 stop:1674 length:585 start_codon:yes stop_codon:yes gene_type:complete